MQTLGDKLSIPGGGGRADKARIKLLDKFTTAQAAPLTSPRTCEPGPGTLTIVDTGNKLSISGEKIMSASTTVNFVDPRALAAAQSRIVGLAIYCEFEITSGSFYISASGNNNIAIRPTPTSIAVHDNFGSSISAGDSGITSGALLIVLRSSGAFYFLQRSGTWELVFVGSSGNASITPGFLGANNSGGNDNYTIDNFAVMQLYGGYLSDFGIATYYDAIPSSGDTAAIDADSFISFKWTPVSSETLELDVRRTDGDNRWVVRCSQAAGTIKLIERNAGVETERASAAQTWTPGTAYTVQVRTVGNDIRTFVDSVAKNTYTSASFNNTATGIKVAGFATGANLASFPRTLTGAALAEVERAIAWLGA